MTNINKYSLALMRGKNNFLPVDWVRLNTEYAHSFLYSLRDIDQFTSTITKEDLLNDLLSKNLISEKEVACPVVIIFYENEGTRILQEGPCFMEDKDYLDYHTINTYIKDNIYNRQLINKIYNDIKNTTEVSVLNFANLLNYSGEILKSKGEIGSIAVLDLIDTYMKALDYPALRKIGMYIAKNLIEKEKSFSYTINGVVDKIWITKENN